MKRLWLLFCYRLSQWREPANLSEDQYLCRYGKHDWSEVGIHRGKSKFASPIVISLPGGKLYEVAQVIRKGLRYCLRCNCNEKQNVFRVEFVQPVPQEILNQLEPRVAKRFCKTKTGWRLEKEAQRDR